jgi:hypothetical protein
MITNLFWISFTDSGLTVRKKEHKALALRWGSFGGWRSPQATPARTWMLLQKHPNTITKTVMQVSATL